MKVGGFTTLRGLMETLRAVLFREAHRPGRIDRHPKVALAQAVGMQHLLLQQCFHQSLVEALERRIGQPTQHPVHRVQVRQPQLEQAAVALCELRLLTQVVERIPRALLKNKQRDRGHQQFAQCIVRAVPTGFDLPELFKQVREKRVDRLK